MLNRDERLDFCKGMLIIGVILGHVYNAFQAGAGHSFFIHEFVRTYDMPMFAFISGILLRKSCSKRNSIQNIKGKTLNILLPALLWNWIFSLLSGHIIPEIGGGLWFLYSLFCSSIIIIVIDKINNTVFQAICFITITIIFHTLIIDPFKIGFLLPPTIVGYYYESIEQTIKRRFTRKTMMISKWCIVFLFVLAQSFWQQSFTVWNLGCDLLKNGQYINNAIGISLRFTIGILGCLVMKDLFTYIYEGFCFRTRPDLLEVKKWIVLWGQATMELYVLHAWIISIAGAKLVNIIIQRIGYNPFLTNEKLLCFIIGPTVTIVSLFLIYYFSMAIKKIPIIGKYVFSFSKK